MDSQTVEETERETPHAKDSDSNDQITMIKRQEKEFLCVDDILERYVGEFGWAQFNHFVLVCLAWTLEGLASMATIFADRVPEWQCVSQNSSQYSNSISTQVCTPDSKLCELDPSLWGSIVTVVKGSSTISEWNLICGDEYKAGLAGSFFFVGGLLGDGLYGNLSDSRLGRRGALALACVMTSIMTLLTAAAPNYWVYVLLRFLTGTNAVGIGLCCFVLGTELVGPKRRESVGILALYFFSIGVMVLPAFGYLSAVTSSWRTLYFSIGITGVSYCAFVLPFLSESPRWFLLKGRAGDALRILRDFAEKNGSFLPPTVNLIADRSELPAEDEEDKASEVELLARNKYENHDKSNPEQVLAFPVVQCDTVSIAINKDDDAFYYYEPRRIRKERSEHAGGTIFDVFRHRETRCRMILMICIWFFIGVAYFGISLNVVNLDFNLYLGVFLNGLTELPAFALPALMLNKLGKKFMLIFALSLSGTSCLLGGFFFINTTGDAENVMNFHSHSMDSLDVLTNWNITSNDRLISHLGQALSSEGNTSSVLAFLRLLCGVAGLFGVGGAYSLVYVYTLELFPTVVRNSALGLASQFASIGSVVAPLVVVLGRYTPSAPFITFGVFSLFGAALALRLPDHRHEALFETLEAMEEAQNVRKRLHSKTLVSNEL